MSRLLVWAGMVFLGGTLLTWAMAAPPAAEPSLRAQKEGSPAKVAQPAKPAKPDTPVVPETLPDRLAQKVDFATIEDPTVSLPQLLKLLQQRYHLDIELNQAAFQDDQLTNLDDFHPFEKPFPAAKGIRLDRLLQQILTRIPNSSGATYLLRRDHLEITTWARAHNEIWGSDYSGPYLALVQADFHRKPLREVVAELADQGDINIVIDNALDDKALSPVTARLRNAPVDTALRLLASMSDLEVVSRDNLFLVTTPERAARLHAKFEREAASIDDGLPRRRGGARSRPSGAAME